MLVLHAYTFGVGMSAALEGVPCQDDSGTSR